VMGAAGAPSPTASYLMPHLTLCGLPTLATVSCSALSQLVGLFGSALSLSVGLFQQLATVSCSALSQLVGSLFALSQLVGPFGMALPFLAALFGRAPQ
jgi:hypothetical protein